MENKKREEEYHQQQPRGIGIPNEVAYNYKLTQTEKILFGFIQNLSRTERGCWASNKYLGKLVGVGTQQISAGLSNLQFYGYIKSSVERSERGTRREIFINDDYIQTYKSFVHFVLDNVNELEADELYESLEGLMKFQERGDEISGEGSQKIRSKESTAIESINREEPISSKEEMSSKEDLPDDESLFLNFSSLRTIHTDPFKKYSEKARGLFEYWNNIGKPLTAHKVDLKNKTFKNSMDKLEVLLKRGYEVEEIKQAFQNYKFFLTMSNNKLGATFYGVNVSLSEFIKFEERTMDYINKNGNEMLKGITCWFEECLQTEEQLVSKWSRIIKDEYPKVTAELERLWIEYGGRQPITVNDENIFRRISKKAYAYFTKLEGVDFIMSERYPISKVHHLFQALEDKGTDFREAHPSWLLSDKMFNEVLPVYWNKMGMTCSEYIDPAEVVNRERRQEERREYQSHFG